MRPFSPLVIAFIHFMLCNFVSQVVSQQECASMSDFMERKLCEQARKSAKVAEVREIDRRTCSTCGCCRDKNIEYTPRCRQECTRINQIQRAFVRRGCDVTEDCKECIIMADDDEEKCWVAGRSRHCEGPLAQITKEVPPHMCNSDAEHPDFCMDLRCLRVFVDKYGMRKGMVLQKARRKEYRMLSEAERDRFHAALWTMKRNGTFDKLFGAAHARYAEGTGAHFGPAFLPWHREFIKRFEFELRMIDPELALPYWDTALDARLANPRDSILFSDELMGNVDSWGQVSSGIFRGWESINWEKLLAGTDLTREYGWANVEYFHDFLDEKRYTVSINIRRNMSDMRIPLMGDEHIAAIVLQPYGSALFGQNNLQNARCPYRNIQTLETFHRYAHMFIGGETGDMNESIRAANDPIFYLLHSFIDLLWELWREKYQSRVQQSTVYPTDLPPSCALVEHSLNLTMHPFEGFTNRDGLSTLYTDNLYFYDWRPSCSYERPFCDSRFLFCDLSHGEPKCVSKMRRGANCLGYSNNEEMCYESVCIAGRCQLPAKDMPMQCLDWCAGQCPANDDYCNVRCVCAR